MKRRYDYFNDTFRAAFSLWVGNKAACCKEFNVRGVQTIVDPEEGGCAGMTQTIVNKKGEILQTLIYLRKMEFTTADYGVLAHECLHSAEFCLRSHGVTFGSCSQDHDECLAYLMEAIYMSFLRQLHEEYKKKPRKKTGAK